MEFSYLCGGVLFFLLTQTTYANGSARNHREGIKDDHSNPILMADLIYTFTGDPNPIQAGKDVSKYKECLSEGSINVPFNEISRANSCDYTVKNKYSDALS